MEIKFNIHETILNYAKILAIIFGCYMIYSFTQNVFKSNSEMTELLKRQNQIEQKIYESNEARSKVETISKGDIKQMIEETFSESIQDEIKAQNEEISKLQTLLLQYNQDKTDMETANIDRNQVWGSDDKLDWLMYREDENSEWKLDYTIHNDFSLNLIETVQEDNTLKFRVNIVDNITNKVIAPKSFDTKINEKWFKRANDKDNNLIDFNVGLYINQEIKPGIMAGIRYNKYSVGGMYDSHNGAGVYFKRHFTWKW